VKPENQPGRLTTIDGVRGSAAMAVVFFHLHGNLETEMAGWLYGVPAWVFSHGDLGVPIFFVLSGFVITLSVGWREISAAFAWRFALRRSIRLDPPYWVSIALAFGLFGVEMRLFPELHRTFPSVPQTLAHLFYLQDILGYGNIVIIYWTLCYEIQFYLFLLLCLYGGQRALRLADTRQVLGNPTFLVCGIALALLSLLQFFHRIDIARNAFFVRYWFCFSLGMFCYWSVAGWITSRWFLIHCAMVLTAGVLAGTNATAIAAAAVGGFLFIAGKRNQNRRWLSGPVFQGLGKISYSLYLTHAIVGWSTISLVKRLLGPTLSVVEVLAAFGAGVLVSITTAAVLYFVVERPTIQLSHIVGVQQKPRVAVGREKELAEA
jgi:peptidoglycan/LPS O-acetylase OafA/YrhL